MRDMSVTNKSSHKYGLFSEVYSTKDNKHGVIVGYSGLPDSPSYMIQFDGDEGHSKSMPFRYVSEHDLSQIPVEAKHEVGDWRVNSDNEMEDQ